MKRQLLAIFCLVLAARCWADPTLGQHTCAGTGSAGQVISQCMDATPCKTISGKTVCLAGQPLPAGAFQLQASCWQYQSTYICEDSATTNSCDYWRQQGCGQIGTSCMSYDANHNCVDATYTFSCLDKPATTTQQTVCDSSFCKDDGSGCFNTTSPPDKDFGQAAAMVEVSREAGVYGVDPNKVEIFKGYMEECTDKVLGGTVLKSCCRAASGGAAYTNHALMSSVLNGGGAVIGQVGKEGLRAGSQYVYDALYGATDSELIDKGLTAMNDWAGGLGSSTSFGAYGFTFSFSMDAGFEFVGFDPYSFAISIAIHMIMEWLSCDPSEQTLMMKKGQNLCVFVGSYCSHKIPLINVCTEVKQQQCCFNSILAKIVNRQGRAQLGLPADQCGGFNQAQLQALDFSRIDFTEFIASLNVDHVDTATMNSKLNQSVQSKVQNYYGH